MPLTTGLPDTLNVPPSTTFTPPPAVEAVLPLTAPPDRVKVAVVLTYTPPPLEPVLPQIVPPDRVNAPPDTCTPPLQALLSTLMPEALPPVMTPPVTVSVFPVTGFL